MIDLFSLLKDTSAYKAIKNDKESGKLSHAYLVVCADGDFLSDYLKIFAKLICCKSSDPCGVCRACRLIDEKRYPDATFYPASGETVSVVDVNDLIEKSYLRPIEGDAKIFVIEKGDTMTAAAQNKLLKTLEEPPAGTYILIGARSEFPILSTVKSRVKKSEISAFSDEKLFSALKSEFKDEEKLKNAISCGDGTVGSVVEFYSDEKLADIERFAEELINDMQSSKNVLDFSVKADALIGELIKEYKTAGGDKIPKEAAKSPEALKRYCLPVVTEKIFSVLEAYFRDMLCYYEGKENLVFNAERLSRVKSAKGYNAASLVYALDKINEARKRKYFNGSGAMLNEWLLFSILEGKHKWQK